MTTNTSVSLMVMYQDESVYIRYHDGSTLNVSPCGSEFMMVKAPDPSAHPMHATEQVRQRTRFAISAYKVLVIYHHLFYIPVDLGHIVSMLQMLLKYSTCSNTICLNCLDFVGTNTRCIGVQE